MNGVALDKDDHVLTIWQITEAETGFTLCAEGSSFLQAAYIHAILKSVYRLAFRRGSLDPTGRNVCATARRYLQPTET